MDILHFLIVFLVLIIVAAILWWFVRGYVIPLAGKLPEPFGSLVVLLIVAALVILLVLALLSLVGIGPGIGVKL